MPEDVERFVRECERRGKPPRIAAVESGEGRYEVWVRTGRGWEYAGEWGAREVHGEPDGVVCKKRTCLLFWRDVMDLAFDRETGEVSEPRWERAEAEEGW